MNNNLYNKQLKGLARKLRREPTRAEKKIWYEVLSSRQLLGYRFLRQRSIGPYIVDFFSPDLNLIIEVDGVSHTFSDVQVNDIKREEWLISKGFKIVRYIDDIVLHDIQRVRYELEIWVNNNHPQPPQGVKNRLHYEFIKDCLAEPMAE